ncbi:3-oxoacyl-[acyl-carrier-protein] reductase FabG-like [Nymphalis io]|uniref:3-oxoacyl-[acyl-carrier-protein] reductase FabG-like n=1 Tax=Inachis io TaxID=171585 RepID=UPI0021674D5D|nr:3-oxoacyl-[acyl-carrier-protein] reductase FabG-like [Nymphalis io]
MSFSGKVVIVTGASSGIGAAAALLFTKECADLTIVGRNEAKLNTVTAQCEEIGKKPLVIKADVSVDDDAAKIINQTIEKFGKIDVLINNAGIVAMGTIMDGTFLEQYEKIAKTNLRAIIKLTTLAIPYLIKTKGNIVNISSVSGQKATNIVFGPYGLTKAGLNFFTNCAALELAPHGVRVNTISPGPVYTDIWDGVKADRAKFKTLKLKTALNRMSQADEVGELILYLASDKAVAITGSNYNTDNGYLLLN